MKKEPKWYAVRTKPRWEKKVAQLLEQKGIEQYCPVQKVYRQWSDRKKLVLEPLFTSYVFTKISEENHVQVKQVSGVINIVQWLGKPAVITEAEIETIKRFLDEYQNVQVQKDVINLNDKVRIVQGPLLSMEGDVVEVMQHSVRVRLPSLGFALTAQIQSSHVEKLSDKEQNRPAQ